MKAKFDIPQPSRRKISKNCWESLKISRKVDTKLMCFFLKMLSQAQIQRCDVHDPHRWPTLVVLHGGPSSLYDLYIRQNACCFIDKYENTNENVKKNWGRQNASTSFQPSGIFCWISLVFWGCPCFTSFLKHCFRTSIPNIPGRPPHWSSIKPASSSSALANWAASEVSEASGRTSNHPKQQSQQGTLKTFQPITNPFSELPVGFFTYVFYFMCFFVSRKLYIKWYKMWLKIPSRQGGNFDPNAKSLRVKILNS